MSKIKCIIIEDEPLAVKVLVGLYFSGAVPGITDRHLKMLFSQRNSCIITNTDLIFLDIHLPKLKGMAFLKTLPESACSYCYNCLSPIRSGRI